MCQMLIILMQEAEIILKGAENKHLETRQEDFQIAEVE